MGDLIDQAKAPSLPDAVRKNFEPISRSLKIAGRPLSLKKWGKGKHLGAGRASPGG
jgi:hypothetical protein